MNFAQEKKGSSRTVGFGVVVLIHVIIIYGLASGLARKITKAVTEDVQVKVVEEVKKPPEEIKKVEPPPPKLDTPPPPFVPPPEVVITAPAPPVATAPTTSTPPPVMTHAAAPTPPAPAARPGPIKAGDVCTKMGRPESPSVSWSGDASYKVVATVKSGRVTEIQVTKLRTGVDRKAERAMIASIESTLKETYECPGDHVFEQQFDFHVDE